MAMDACQWRCLSHVEVLENTGGLTEIELECYDDDDDENTFNQVFGEECTVAPES
jgi:hypothetical protein